MAQDPTPSAPLTAASTAASAKAPEDRSTTFQPVEGGGEMRSGATLLVEAYAVLWVILFGWLVLLWRRQHAQNRRIDELEQLLQKASRPR